MIAELVSDGGPYWRWRMSQQKAAEGCRTPRAGLSHRKVLVLP